MKRFCRLRRAARAGGTATIEVIACLLAVACGAETAAAPALLECPGPDESKAPVDRRLADETYDEEHEARLDCNFGPGDDTSKTIGADAPLPPQDIHVVVVMLENRSFDHYLSRAPNTESSIASKNPNPLDPSGFSVQKPAQSYCLVDPPHEWGPAHREYDNGLLDGFVAAGNPSGERSLAYYTADDLPFSHWLAENFAVGDFYFSSLIGPTWPNRLFLFKGTSCGYTLGALDGNFGITRYCGAVEPNVLQRLEQAHFRHKLYDESGPASVTLGLGLDVPESIDQFRQDAAAGTLPEFSMVGASTGKVYGALGSIGIGAAEDDDHPPADVRLGETFLYNVVKALMSNKEAFKKTILFITFDENGGFYDHVPPPRACEPEPSVERHDFAFDRYGFRVPFIVVSPYVRSRGYVSHHVTDHTSILRFVEHTWGLPAMTRRDANAWPLLDYFDFGSELPEVTLPPPPVVTGGCEKAP